MTEYNYVDDSDDATAIMLPVTAHGRTDIFRHFFLSYTYTEKSNKKLNKI